MDDVRARRRRRWGRLRDTVVVLAEYTAESVYGLLRPAWRRDDVTPEEERGGLPGDDLVPAANWEATRAVSIAAGPGDVWPWLVQLGYGRGGWYGDLPWWKDPQGHTGSGSSSWDLLPEARIAVGDVLLDGPNCDATTGAWRVARVDEGRSLVLTSSRTLSGREVTDGRPPPSSWFSCSWAFVLRPVDEGSRLVVRTRLHYRPAWMVRVASVLRRGDAVMQRAMLLGIRRRVEARVGTAGTTPPARQERAATVRSSSAI